VNGEGCDILRVSIKKGLILHKRHTEELSDLTFRVKCEILRLQVNRED
jgi:hypothetical protein